MIDAAILLDAVFWPTLVMAISLGFCVAVLLRLRPQRGY